MIHGKKKVLIPLAVLILVGLSMPALAAGFGTLQGKVTDKLTGRPIAGAVVKVKVGDGIIATTNEKGIYLFNNTIPRGRHNVVVKKQGYKRKIIWLFNIESGINTLNVKLKPRQ